MDIERVRGCDSPEGYQDGDWIERGMNDDLCAEENLSRVSQSLKRRIELSEDAANERTEEDKRLRDPMREKWMISIVGGTTFCVT